MLKAGMQRAFLLCINNLLLSNRFAVQPLALREKHRLRMISTLFLPPENVHKCPLFAPTRRTAKSDNFKVSVVFLNLCTKEGNHQAD